MNKLQNMNHLTIKNTKNSKAFTAASLSAVGATAFLFGLTYGLICPVVQPDSTSAESNSSISTVSDVASTVSDTTSISITAPSTVTIDLTPDFDKAVFATASANISVTTTNAYGYTLSMGTSGTDSTGTTTTSLIHKTKSTNTIPSITSATTEANFPTNSWGYTTDNNGTDTDLGQITAGYYQPLTTSDSSTVIKTTETTASADTTTVTFGAKADSTLPSGDYTNTIVFSATANPQKLTIFDIDNMQEMTADVCSNTTTPASSATSLDTDGSHKSDTSYIPQTALTDTRDSKSYAIRKLADGNCWMVQNLALGVGTALSSDDTDIESTSTYIMPTTSTTNFTAGSNPSGSGDNNNEMHTGTHTDGYVASVDDGSLYSSDLTDTGNWYSWYVATAGTGTNTMSSGKEATSSICPKGWNLPTGKTTGQFYTLYIAYGSSQATLNAIFPLQLSGYYDSSGLYYSGSNGYWWSSTASSTTRAYLLYAYQSYINPASTSNKYYGFSVRCVAASS